MAFEEANDVVASERTIFSKHQNYKKFTLCHNKSICTYILGFKYIMWWEKTDNIHIRMYTHTMVLSRGLWHQVCATPY